MVFLPTGEYGLGMTYNVKQMLKCTYKTLDCQNGILQQQRYFVPNNAGLLYSARSNE